MTDFSHLLTRDQIRSRLPEIFPDGIPRRVNAISPAAAATIFVALYINAVEGGTEVLQPKPIYRMTEEQAALTGIDDRLAFAKAMSGRTGQAVGNTRWYQDNSRETIRDDVIRETLVPLGAVTVDPSVTITANKPRYVLSAGFAALFDPGLQGEALADAIAAWRASALSPGALARIALTLQGATVGNDDVLITFPNGDTRRMRPGPSANITKAVIEVFAPRFLAQPVVIATSDSAEKVTTLDETRAKAIGLNVKADQNLPDVILVDLAPSDPLLVFIEVVASDGPISERRMEALHQLVAEAGFPPHHVAFVTAYLDRSVAPFRGTIGSLAWGSYAWFMSEPEGLLELNITRKTLG
ncbi:MAG: BsuBI/PstI family type II restriction endonuclease [Brevundimonas sp.]